MTTPLPGSSTLATRFDWPPTCPRCGWSGEPTAQASPYIACGGDPDDPRTWPAAAARHRRQPVTATRAEVSTFTPTPAQPVPAVWRAGPARAPQGGSRVGGRGNCSVCGLEFAVYGGSVATVLYPHGPRTSRCPGSENPPAATPPEPA
jgi:hypothetical protein